MGNKDDIRLGIAKLEDRLGVHRSTIARWVREPEPENPLPAPHYIGDSRMWWLSEIMKWEAAEQKRGAERAATKHSRLDVSEPSK